MLHGYGVSDRMLPVKRNEDGKLTELTGVFVPMINTLSRDINGVDVWQSDVCEADIKLQLMDDMPPTLLKAIGIMMYDIPTASFTLTIHNAPETMAGKKYQVINVKVLGSFHENPELLPIKH